MAALGAINLGLYITNAALPFSLRTVNRPLVSFAGITGQNEPGVHQYLATVGLPFLFYAAGFLVLWRWRVSKGPVFAFPLLFSIALFLVYPLTSLDAFLYGAQGWTLAHHGANPLVVPSTDFPANPFLPWAPFAHKPSTYGPLWLYLASLSVWVGGGQPIGTLVALKVIGLVTLLASTVLCYLIGERLQPGKGVTAAYTLGWNPLALWVTVANAHNDMTMVVLILIGCFFLIDRPLLALPVIVVAGLVKYAAVLLVPLFVVHLFRNGYPRRCLMLSVGIAALCGWVVLWPLWAGSATANGLDQLKQMMTMSPGATIVFWAKSLGYPPERAGDLARHYMVVLFALTYAVTLLTISEKIESTLAASFVALFAVLVLATFWFRGWYIVWPLALAAVLTAKYKWLAAAGIVFSGGGLLVYLFTDYLWVWYGTDLRLHQYVMLTVFFPPLLVLCTGSVLHLTGRSPEQDDGNDEP